MTIPVEHEDIEELKKWGMGIADIMELCYFCKAPTRYWYVPKNEPCCQQCAIWHGVEEFK